MEKGCRIFAKRNSLSGYMIQEEWMVASYYFVPIIGVIILNVSVREERQKKAINTGRGVL